MDLRKMLYQNIVLSGGSTLFRGFGDRLLSELKKSVSKDMKIRVCVQSPMNLPIGVVVVYEHSNLGVDLCAAGATVLDVDGRLNSCLAGHVQENVDIQEGVRRGRSSGHTPQDVLDRECSESARRTISFQLEHAQPVTITQHVARASNSVRLWCLMGFCKRVLDVFAGAMHNTHILHEIKCNTPFIITAHSLQTQDERI